MFKKIKRHKMKRVFLLLVLVVIVMTNSFAQARKVMCTEETMFVEEYVVDSLRKKGLWRQVSPIMPVVAENDPVIKNWLLESFHYFLPKDVVQLLKNYNDKWKYCFSIVIRFDSEGNILYFLFMGSEEICDQLTVKQINSILDKVRLITFPFAKRFKFSDDNPERRKKEHGEISVNFIELLEWIEESDNKHCP